MVSLKFQTCADHSGCESSFFMGFNSSCTSGLFDFSCLEGRGLKIGDILKDDEVLTAFLLRDAELSESIVYQLVNAKIRLEQVQFGKATACAGLLFPFVDAVIL